MRSLGQRASSKQSNRSGLPKRSLNTSALNINVRSATFGKKKSGGIPKRKPIVPVVKPTRVSSKSRVNRLGLQKKSGTMAPKFSKTRKEATSPIFHVNYFRQVPKQSKRDAQLYEKKRVNIKNLEKKFAPAEDDGADAYSDKYSNKSNDSRGSLFLDKSTYVSVNQGKRSAKKQPAKQGNKFTMMKPLLTSTKNLFYNTRAAESTSSSMIGSHLVQHTKKSSASINRKSLSRDRKAAPLVPWR